MTTPLAPSAGSILYHAIAGCIIEVD